MKLGLLLIKGVDQILQNFVLGQYEEFKKKLKTKKEQENFKNNLKDFADKFTAKHQNEIVATSQFADYLDSYNVIGHVLDYYFDPNESPADFCKKQSTMARSLLGKTHPISPVDKSIEDFYRGVYDFVNQYFLDKISTENIASYHVLMQSQKTLEKLEGELRLPKPVVRKNTYSLNWDPIPRRFFRQNYGDHAQIIYHDNLFEICQNEKHVVLLDTAGAGKSVELQHVAAIASLSENNTYPILINLQLYVEQPIEDIIHETYPEVDYDQLFLIIDGYDEVLPEKSLELARSVNSFVHKHPNTKILVSSRSNFYQICNENGKGSTFTGFKVYGIAPLSPEDIDVYVKSKGIQRDYFWSIINANSLDDLIMIPFYLNYICELLQGNVVISGKSQLMYQIVCSLFEHDLQKYVNTVQLDEQRESILWQLGKLAFAMQSMHQKSLSDTDYQLLMGANPFSLIRYSGLFKKTTNKTWEFEHNNFREYLAAKYLAGLGLEDIKAVICVEDGFIKESWINVLSYLVVISDDDSILNWIVDTNPEIVIFFEKDKLPQDKRTKIIIALLNTWAERNVWLSRKYGHISRIAEFGHSETLIDYLLDRISNPNHFRERANALHILFFSTNMYGKEQEIRQVLFDFIQKDVGEEYGRYIAIETLGELQLHSPEITDYLVSHLTKNHGDYELGVIKYLSKHENPGEYLQVLFEQYLLARDESKSGHEWNICASIEEIILSFTSFELLRDAFLFFAENSSNYSSYEEVLNRLTDKLILHYQAGNTETADVVFKGWMIGAKEFNQTVRSCCFRFFVSTDTRHTLIRAMATHTCESDDYHAVFEFEYCADKDCYIILGESYRMDQNTYGSFFYKIASRLPVKHEFYETYATLLRENVIELPQKESFRNYELFRKEGSQIYFDSLFDKERYRALLYAMLKKVDKFEACFSDPFWDEYPFLDPSNADEHAYQLLTYDIKHMENDPHLVRDLPDMVDNWDWYAINEIKNVLRGHDGIYIKNEQRKYIEIWCRNMLQKIDFDRDMKPWSFCSMTYALKQVIVISNMFDINYEREVFLDFLKIPRMIIEERNTRETNDIFASYVTAHLTDEDIQKQVQKNIEARNMCLLSAQEHLKYCQENKLVFAVDYAREICERESDDYDIRGTAIQYLIAVRGYDYVLDLYLDTTDEELFKCLVYATESIQNSRITEKMEEKNKKSSDRTLYLSRLIRTGSKHGLQTLCSLLEERMSVSQCRGEDTTETITRELEVIHNPSLLPELARLQAIRFKPGFQDDGFITMYESLRRAFVNVAQNNYCAVVNHLKATCAKTVFGSDEQFFCNSLLDDIRQTHTNKLDVAWSIKKIKQFFQQHKGIMDY